jgi:hypothetical protein
MISFILGLCMPFNLKNYIPFEFWYFLLTLTGIIIFCFWIYNYVIFNKEKNYGNRQFFEEYLNFFLVFITVAAYLLMPWPFEIMYNKRVADKFSTEEVLSDLNKVNRIRPYLALSPSDFYSRTDTVQNKSYYNIKRLSIYAGQNFTPWYIQDSAKYPQVYSHYQLFKMYKPLTDEKILKIKIDSFIEIAQKYDVHVTESSASIAGRYLKLLDKGDMLQENDFVYMSSDVFAFTTIFDNIANAKFKPLFIFTSEYLWTILYFVISITALLLLFKTNYWQQFLIMLAVAFLYPLITLIITQLIPYDYSVNREILFMLSLLAMIVFSKVTLFITWRSSNRYRPFYNIFNQLFYITLVFTPLLILFYLHESTNIFHNKGYDMIETDIVGVNNYYGAQNNCGYGCQLENYYSNYWRAEFDRWIDIAKYSGIVLFLIGLPFFKELFVKQISLPKKT